MLAARSPTEQVYPAIVRRGDVTIGITYVVVLVLGKLPCVCGSPILQVALREIDLVPFFVDGEFAVYGTCGGGILS